MSEHEHEHEHDHGALSRPALALAFWLTTGVLAVDVIQGFRTHSVALLADALHVGTDLFALGLSWWAIQQSTRGPDRVRTYGYQRVSILAALTNAVTLFLLILLVGAEAVPRLFHPPMVDAAGVVPAAMFNLLINGFILTRLRKGGGDVNTRSATLHIAGDMAATLGVLVGAIAMWFWGAAIIDPLVSMAIACLVVWEAYKIIREAVNILLEGIPQGLSPQAIESTLLQAEGIRGCHHLHVWCLGSETRALSCHLVLDDLQISQSAAILRNVEEILRRLFSIEHTTIQIESESCGPDLDCHFSHPSEGTDTPPDRLQVMGQQ